MLQIQELIHELWLLNLEAVVPDASLILLCKVPTDWEVVSLMQSEIFRVQLTSALFHWKVCPIQTGNLQTTGVYYSHQNLRIKYTESAISEPEN